MADNAAEDIRKLEHELREVIKQGDFTEALDILDEIESKGAIKAGHLAVKGQCLLKLRRKQDAKGVLLHAFELDPACDAATKLLDENFPGWTRPKAPPRSAPAPMPPVRPQAPPSGAAPAAGSSSPGFSLAAESGYAPAPSGMAAPQPVYQMAQPGISPTGSHPGFSIQPHVVQAGYAAPPTEALVNWRYVLEDLKSVPPAPALPSADQRVIPVG